MHFTQHSMRMYMFYHLASPAQLADDEPPVVNNMVFPAGPVHVLVIPLALYCLATHINACPCNHVIHQFQLCSIVRSYFQVPKHGSWIILRLTKQIQVKSRNNVSVIYMYHLT